MSNWAKRFSDRACICGVTFSPSGTRDIWCSTECRFWSHVDKSAGPDACWPWIAGTFKTGYGQFTVNGDPLYAHREALELSGIKIPDGMYATHGCDNPICCNPHPDHVRIGSPSLNAQEMHDRGRRHNVNYARGDRHGMRKLKLKKESSRGFV